MKDRCLKFFSFYNAAVAPDIPVYQRSVSEKFGLSVNQVMDAAMTPTDFLNDICRRVTDTDYLIFFDIDCIPTKRMWLNKLITDLLEPHTIVGCAQTAHHLQDVCNLYVSPFFYAISTAYLKELHYPDLHPTDQVAAAQNLTEQVRLQQGTVRFWWPTHVEEPKWKLHHPSHKVYGLGTTYDDMVYHAFEWKNGRAFVQKCKAILAEQEGPGLD
ncbi:hypothetical protein GA0116948_105284 [Chitinophaga costaii]|uniref:Glycosyl transferase family 2 n=1 Tax=Chitinophaga costaii TaxID=1335309 RepID=A0A1C4DI25_9BACT|nr:hypothetical protein [Chitinophaga costaii]PUZ24643.1 hypothetical protein DCM91_12180 [Chitinophaga costaii]SCC30971.1 hypothetical protein GA0116948_105284 [Chitinophaga costaii]